MLDGLVLLGLLSQFCFFAFRIRWRDPWWRVGASFAVLMAFLGDAVWEGYPSAAPRVLLPMTLAFNILVPRRAWWPILLLAGNLGVLGSGELLKPLEKRDIVVEGPLQLRLNPTDGYVVEAAYGPRNWWPTEWEAKDHWRWSGGDSTVTIHNPQPFTIVADLAFGLATGDVRSATMTVAGHVAWSARVRPAMDNEARISGIDLPPGDTLLLFQSDRPAARPGPGDRRLITFSVRDLTIVLKGRR
jgi:hypothetical protein